MISCYPQNGEELLTSRQLREKADKIMSEIPAFQDRMKTAEKKLLDRLLADERLTDKRWIAYIMATCKHETNHTFEPIEEAYWLSNAWRQANLRYWPAHGRGFVQITWPANYEKMSHRLDMPALASNYDLALEWNVAYEILVIGMLEGLFTGRDLDDFINEQYCDYFRARKIVNGMDKAALIAGYAADYEDHHLQPAKQPKPAGTICSTATWRRGDMDYCVNKVQTALIGAGLDVEPDAVFGKETQQAVRYFQDVRGLTVDGVVGPETWSRLESYL